jgi:hypothetical protein
MQVGHALGGKLIFNKPAIRNHKLPAKAPIERSNFTLPPPVAILWTKIMK